MNAAQLDLDEPIRLHPLTYLAEGEDVTVGRADIDSYGVFPADGAELVRRLEAGASPNEAAGWYQQQFGEMVDIAELIEALDELDLLVADGEEIVTSKPVKWQRLGGALFSRPAFGLYTLLVAGAIAAMVHDHGLVPRYQHLFFTRRSLTVLALGVVLGQVPWMLLHEMFHALAGRRLGLNSRLSIGRRFYYVVFVTSLDGLVAVPRRKRYLPMLAGMLLDVLALASLTIAAAALSSSGGFGALLYKYLLSMAFAVLMRLAWQFYFFLRTDLFFLTANVLGCNDLQGASRGYLANKINTVLRRRARLLPADTWTARDAAVARWYSWLTVAGYGLLVFLVVTVMAPTAVRIVEIVVHELRQQNSVLGVADLVFFLFLNFSEFLLAGFLALRAAYRKRLRPASQRGAEPDVRAAATSTPTNSDVADQTVTAATGVVANATAS
jgi:hypothetical protein